MFNQQTMDFAVDCDNRPAVLDTAVGRKVLNTSLDELIQGFAIELPFCTEQD